MEAMHKDEVDWWNWSGFCYCRRRNGWGNSVIIQIMLPSVSRFVLFPKLSKSAQRQKGRIPWASCVILSIGMWQKGHSGHYLFSSDVGEERFLDRKLPGQTLIASQKFRVVTEIQARRFLIGVFSVAGVGVMW